MLRPEMQAARYGSMISGLCFPLSQCSVKHSDVILDMGRVLHFESQAGEMMFGVKPELCSHLTDHENVTDRYVSHYQAQ